MPSCEVKPVFLNECLCTRPYPGHPHGCPNFGRKDGCPPGPCLCELLDLGRPIYAIWTTFDLAAHRRRMALLHPGWTRRQLDCCLYWQGGARKNLRAEVRRFMERQGSDLARHGLLVVPCPEGASINVTETMRAIGEHLQWPPDTTTYQIVLAGTPGPSTYR